VVLGKKVIVSDVSLNDPQRSFDLRQIESEDHNIDARLGAINALEQGSETIVG